MSEVPEIDPDNPPELEPLLKSWMAVLRLTDYDVKIAYTYNSDASTCSRSAAYKRAFIDVMHPRCWSGRRQYDLEHEIVHELLHLYWAPLNTGDHSTVAGLAEEQCVESLTRAFLSLKRFLPAKRKVQK